jgi:ankyrin repeat protein
MKTRAVMLTLAWALAGTVGAAEAAREGELIQAAGWGDLATVEALIKSGVDVNYETKPGLSALTEAIRRNHPDVVRALLAAKADVNPGKPDKAPILQTEDTLDMIPVLLEAGANPNVVNSSGATPLFHAVQGGRLDIVKVLLAAGADPSPRTSNSGGRSALVLALTNRSLEMAMVLLKAGANVNAATDYQDTALRIASAGDSRAHLEMVRALLARGADTEAGQVPARRVDESCFLLSGRCGTTTALRSRKAEGTALGIAADSGSVEIVKALLVAGAKVDAPQPGWRTPLMIAAVAGREDVVRVLLEAGANPQAVDGNGQTALMRVAAVMRAPRPEPAADGALAEVSLTLNVGWPIRVNERGWREVAAILQAAGTPR